MSPECKAPVSCACGKCCAVSYTTPELIRRTTVKELKEFLAKLPAEYNGLPVITFHEDDRAFANAQPPRVSLTYHEGETRVKCVMI